MAIQGYVGWATNVNRIILDATNITVGNDALLEEETESLNKQSMLKGAFVPDDYAVTMSFECMAPIEGIGKTEYQLFLDWYKYSHKFGTIPFEFPKILYSNETGIKKYDQPKKKVIPVEFYKITSPLQTSKSGEHMMVTMNWKSVYMGTVSVEAPLPHIVGIIANKDYTDILFDAVSDTAPVSSQFTLYKGNTILPLTGFYYDGHLTVRAYYEQQESGTISFSCSYSGLVVQKGEYTSDI